ncbi:MAG TPA: MFS transporter [Woeseiaceae bacterium]|nr:MFS transporter [Woeseiaceae bacterium]
MFRAIASITALLLGVAILLTGQGLQGTLLPVRAAMEEFSTVAIGAFGAAYFLGFTVGSWKGAGLVQRVGHVRVFAAMTALASASPLLHGMWIDMWSWCLLRFLSGFCFAILYVVIESWLNETSTNENRGSVFSIYVLINMTMLAAGQQMLLLDDPAVMTLFALASVLVSLAAVPVALSTAPTPRQLHGNTELDIPHLYRTSPAGMLGSLATGLANGSFWALAPVFTISFSTDVALTAWFMTAAVLGGAASQWPLGAWSDRIDRRYVMAFAASLAIAVALAIWLFADRFTHGGLILLGGLWGAAAFPLYSISIAHSNDHAAEDEYVMVSSGLLLMYGIGAVAGPVLSSIAMYWLGSAGLFAFTGSVHLLLFVYLLQRRLRRRMADVEDHAPFADALTASQTTSQVYESEIVTKSE